MDGARIYIAIDLKSFYASVECVERRLDPLDTNLVVADISRTEKTICLAVSPSLKALGIGGRPRLFEVVQKVRKANRWRGRMWKSVSGRLLAERQDFAVDYIVAPPRMALYIDYSARIYEVYLKYIAPEDIHIYSIDEVFIDATAYLKMHRMTAHTLAMTMIRDVLAATGITATAGIGTNMYLAKVAMDIVAKKQAPDSDGVRIAELDEDSYRRTLWSHMPLSDFWRVGHGIEARLAPYGIRTMGDIARMSLANENVLFCLLGINAELLIDHAWGREPVTMDLVKAYRPESSSLGTGQVLTEAYTTEKAEIVAMEMAESLALDLFGKHLVTEQLVLTIGYDVENLKNKELRDSYDGEIVVDRFGRKAPKHAHGTVCLGRQTSSARLITEAVRKLFGRIARPGLLIRRINLTAGKVMHESLAGKETMPLQLNLFVDYDTLRRQRRQEEAELAKERRLMAATLALKRKFGKNALLKGLDYAEGATTRIRNTQIGGHKA